MKRRILISAFCLMLGAFSACGETNDSKNDIVQGTEFVNNGLNSTEDLDTKETEEEGRNDSAPVDDLEDTTQQNTADDAKAEEMKRMFGENCIAEQTFEVELSEVSGKVYFVPYAPSAENPDFSMQIIQDGEVLLSMRGFVPEKLEGEKFTSLDAVSFYDVNYDDYTDIVLITTYGDTSFAQIYFGSIWYFYDNRLFFEPEITLSEKVTDQVETLSLPEIRTFLTDGKKNGEFTDYQEAYKAVSKLCELAYEEGQEYDLIYFDEDDVPELVAGLRGYYVSLYTYHDGRVYNLMDNWGYGAMGNAGYEYSQGKNSLRNYNADFAGLIMYTTYMRINAQYSLETVVQIKTQNWDDVNENGYPDEDEMESAGYYGVSYIDGVEVTPEECAAYDAGEYEYIEPVMSLEELWGRLL